VPAGLTTIRRLSWIVLSRAPQHQQLRKIPGHRVVLVAWEFQRRAPGAPSRAARHIALHGLSPARLHAQSSPSTFSLYTLHRLQHCINGTYSVTAYSRQYLAPAIIASALRPLARRALSDAPKSWLVGISTTSQPSIRSRRAPHPDRTMCIIRISSF
jgi:hypothetical protein